MKKQKFKLKYQQKDKLQRLINPEYKLNVSERAKRKAKVILLRAQEKSIKEIINETGLCKRTIISYVKEYSNPDLTIGGMRFIHKNDYKISSLKGVQGLLDDFRITPPETYREAKDRIKKLYNITISESAVRAYLNKNENKIYTSRSRSN